MDVKGCYVDVKGCYVDVKGYYVDVKGSVTFSVSGRAYDGVRQGWARTVKSKPFMLSRSTTGESDSLFLPLNVCGSCRSERQS